MANMLEQFKAKVIEPQRKRTEDATKIMNDATYKWRDAEQKKNAQAKLESYQAWLAFYEKFYEEGVKLCTQHENLTNKMSKWYEVWRNDVSNDGLQEKEMMSVQADMLNELFSEMYKELKSLNLDIKAPAALNMK